MHRRHFRKTAALKEIEQSNNVQFYCDPNINMAISAFLLMEGSSNVIFKHSESSSGPVEKRFNQVPPIETGNLTAKEQPQKFFGRPRDSRNARRTTSEVGTRHLSSTTVVISLATEKSVVHFARICHPVLFLRAEAAIDYEGDLPVVERRPRVSDFPEPRKESQNRHE